MRPCRCFRARPVSCASRDSRATLLAIASAIALSLLVPWPAHAAYVQSDLAGTWRSHSVASGPGAPWWERGQVWITPAGGLTVHSIDSYGERDTVVGQLALDPSGIVTLPVAPDFHGALDLGATVFAANDQWVDDPDHDTVELKLGVETLGSYGVADLAGEWEFNSIASGPGEPWWIRGRQTILPNGFFSGTFTESSGAIDPVSGTMVVASDGGVTLSVAPGALGWVDAGRTVLVLTNTWPDGSSELITGLRMAASYAQADLAGTWEIHGIATGPGAPWSSHGQITVATSGVYSGSMLDNAGRTSPVSGTFTLASNGVITRSGSSVARGVLERGRTVMVWTDTWSTWSPGTTEMMVGVRTGGSAVGVPPSAAASFALERVRPNPTRASALAIGFTLADAGAARLTLLDVAGRAIVVRDVGALGAGTHRVALAPEARVAPGLYFVRLTQGARERIERAIVLE